MISTQLIDNILKLTKTSDLEQSLKILLPEFIKLKIYFIKQQIAQYEMKWNMSYEEFEEKSTEFPDGFTFEVEQEYYDWGEKVALVQHYKNMLKEWI